MEMVDQKLDIGLFLRQYAGLASVSGNTDAVDYRRLSIDSRTIRPGDLFVAIIGERHDGHRFAFQALEKGAAAVVVNAAWLKDQSPPQHSAALIAVADTLDFLQQLAAWHRRRFDIPVVAVTGSNGKTTTREMIVAILSRKYQVFGTEGNKNNHIGLPLMLLQIDESCQMAVLELGTNHPGEIGLLTELAGPTAAVITNIGKGHIGYFGGLQAVYREKTSLFETADSEATLFLNMQDALLSGYPQDARTVTVGISSEVCEVFGQIQSVDDMGNITLRFMDRIDIPLNIPGKHQLENALLALAVGRHFQVDESEMAAALAEVSAVSQRMQVERREGVLYINDAYNANPDSMRAAVAYLAGLPVKGRRVLVLGDMLEMGELAEHEHYELGRYIAAQPVQRVYCYGPMGEQVVRGIHEHGNNQIVAASFEKHDQIIADIKTFLAAGDALLFKGSRGMKMETVLEGLWQ